MNEDKYRIIFMRDKPPSTNRVTEFSMYVPEDLEKEIIERMKMFYQNSNLSVKVENIKIIVTHDS